MMNKQIIKVLKLLVIVIGVITIISINLVENKVDSLLNIFISAIVIIVLGMAVFEKTEGRNRDFLVSIAVAFIFSLFLFSRLI